jgi:hypothetical protein
MFFSWCCVLESKYKTSSSGKKILQKILRPSGNQLETVDSGITLWQIEFDSQQKTSSEEEVFANLIARDGTFTRPRFSLRKFLENV